MRPALLFFSFAGVNTAASISAHNRHAGKLTDDCRQRLAGHGHLSEREIVTGIGPVAARCPRVRNRIDDGSERIRLALRFERFKAVA